MLLRLADGQIQRKIGSMKRAVLAAEKSEVERKKSVATHTITGAHSTSSARRAAVRSNPLFSIPILSLAFIESCVLLARASEDYWAHRRSFSLSVTIVSR